MVSPAPAPLPIERFAAELRDDLGFQEGVPAAALALLPPGMIALYRPARERAALVRAEVVVLFAPTGDGAPFPFAPETLVRFAEQCRPLAPNGLFGLVKQSVRVSFFVLTDQPLAETDREMLKTLRRPPPSIAQTEAYYVNVDTGAWWSSAAVMKGDVVDGVLVASGETFSFPRWLAARRADAPPEVKRAIAALPGTFRWASALTDAPATMALLALIAVFYFAESAYARTFGDPEVGVLRALGGVSGPAVLRDHEWFRLLSATLLHVGFLHVFLNGLALVLGGALLEGIAGRRWMLVVYVASALGGSLLGIRINAPNVITAGASGAIMGLLSAALIAAFRYPRGPHRSQIQGQVARFLIPSLIPLASSITGTNIDYAAHLGGAITGALLGAMLLLTWPRAERQPRGQALVGALAAIGVLALVGSGAYAFARGLPQREQARLSANAILVPSEAIPHNTQEAADRVETWGKDHPRDPRVHLYRALHVLENDPALAERELRAALADRVVLDRFFEDGKLERFVRSILGVLLVEQGRPDEAAREVAVVCAEGEEDGSAARVREAGLCTQDHGGH